MLQLRGKPHRDLPGLREIEESKGGPCEKWANGSFREKRRDKRRSLASPSTPIALCRGVESRRRIEPCSTRGPCCQSPTRSPSSTHSYTGRSSPLKRQKRLAPATRPGLRSLRQKCLQPPRRLLPKRPALHSAQPNPHFPSSWCLHLP